MEGEPQTDIDSLIHWTGMTTGNADNGITLPEAIPVKKRGRGRPKKGSNTPELARSIDTDPIETMPAEDLIRGAMGAPEPEPIKSVRLAPVRDDVPDSRPIDSDKACLLGIYRSFFKEPLASRHSARQKTFTDKHTSADVFREIEDIQREVRASNPMAMLSAAWLTTMGLVENAGVSSDIPLQNLTRCCQLAADQPDTQDIFRDLLIKYPYLRRAVSLGGFPEIQLLVLSATIVTQVMQANAMAASVPDK